MAAYVIAEVEVSDPHTFEQYRRGVPATLAPFQGRFIVRGGESCTLEGDWQPKRLVVIGAGLLVRSFTSLLDNDPGFRADRRVALQLFLWDRNQSAEQRIQRMDEISTRLAATPGVLDVGLVSALPFHPHAIDAQGVYTIEGRATPPPGHEQRVYATLASGDYFRTMGLPLQRGAQIGEVAGALHSRRLHHRILREPFQLLAQQVGAANRHRHLVHAATSLCRSWSLFTSLSSMCSRALQVAMAAPRVV